LALKKIDNAISKGKKLVILPESLLPYFLNLEHPYLDKFKERSKKITIIIGALYFKGQNNYRNSAYIIKDGNFSVANKVVLVPFGEANPLPKFMSKIVNKIFFDGAVDYKADSNYTTIKALNKEFKIAICYEGTAKKTYQDYPKFVIVISNNGWFKPSIEPTLQQILLKFYARVYGTTIYHSINGSKSYVVLPYPEGD
jgi:apolipoprotein N-acyltransferase